MGPVYIVPEGRVFDVSIPRPMRLFLSPHNRRFLKAAALHDDMLCHGLCDQTVCDGGHPPELKADQVKWSREEAAGAFAAALKADGVGYWTRLIMHVGVIIWTTRRP